MKLNEIMILRNDNNETRLKLLQVDDETMSKLTRIRGNLYKDDPRLKVVKDMPEHKKPLAEGVVITDEMRNMAEESWRLYCMVQEAGTRAAASTPELPKPMTFEEQLAHDWRFNPGIRKEFTSQASYEAYMKAEKVGRTRLFGGG